MPRPTKEERTCPKCGSTNTYRMGHKARNRFVPHNKRYCVSCDSYFKA